jgi:site-specific DNA-adenine methylase
LNLKIGETYLYSINQYIIDFINKNLLSLIVYIRLSLDVIIIIIRTLKNTSSNTLYNGAKNKEYYCKEGVIDSYFLSTSVATSLVIPEYNKI